MFRYNVFLILDYIGLDIGLRVRFYQVMHEEHPLPYNKLSLQFSTKETINMKLVFL